jgi:hypothetical protein
MNFFENWLRISLDNGDGSLELVFLIAASTFVLLFGLRRQILTRIYSRFSRGPALQ